MPHFDEVEIGPVLSDTAAQFFLMHLFGEQGATTSKFRAYASAGSPPTTTEGLCFTFNASWNSFSQVWQGDDTSTNAFMFIFNDAGITLRRKLNVLPASWNDATWESATGMRINQDGVLFSGTPSILGVSATAVARPVHPLHGVSGVAGSTVSWEYDGTNLEWVSQANSGDILFPLIVPRGSTLTSVDVMVTPGEARSTPNNIQLQVFELDPVFPATAGTGASIGTDEDDEGTGIQLVSASSITGHSAVGDTTFSARVTAGNTGGATADTIHAVRYAYTSTNPLTVNDLLG